MVIEVDIVGDIKWDVKGEEDIKGDFEGDIEGDFEMTHRDMVWDIKKIIYTQISKVFRKELDISGPKICSFITLGKMPRI